MFGIAEECMKHWYVTEPETLSLAEEPVPQPDAGEVLIRLHYTALSPGSSLHVYQSGSYGPSQPTGKVDVLYMGSGVIETVGDGVDPSRAGQRVAFTGIGHQEYGVVAEKLAIPVPNDVPLDIASLAYLSAWSVSALHLGAYAAAETVAVVGLGLVGASAAITADAMGARVLGIDADPDRLAFGRSLGLGCVEDAITLSSSDAARGFLDDAGADLIIETSGSWAGFRTAWSLARDYSRIALMGIYREPPPPDLQKLLHQEIFGFPSKMHYQRLQIIGCGSDPETLAEPMPRMATKHRNFAWALEQAARGRLRLDALKTSTRRPDEIESVLRQLLAGDRSEVGIVFDWTGESGTTGSTA